MPQMIGPNGQPMMPCFMMPPQPTNIQSSPTNTGNISTPQPSQMPQFMQMPNSQGNCNFMPIMMMPQGYQMPTNNNTGGANSLSMNKYSRVYNKRNKLYLIGLEWAKN